MSLQLMLPRHRGIVHTDTGLVLPPEAERDVIGRCRVPTGDDKVCGAVFFKGQEREMELHIVGNGDRVGCLQRNAEHVNAGRRSVKTPEMLPWDPERAEYAKRHREALLSGRKSL